MLAARRSPDRGHLSMTKEATMSAGKPGRNDKCPCGSDRKYKQCCLEKDEEAAREARAKAAEEAAAAAANQDAPAPVTHNEPWRRGSDINTQGFRPPSAPRKAGSG
jgi:hypothetical protein